MNLLQLQYFLEVAQQEHLSKAANILNISQPALSITISHLEKELGHPLFDRIGRNIRLNEYGQTFYNYISQAILAIESGKNAVQDLNAGSHNVVSIASTGTRILQGFSLEQLMCSKDIRLIVHRINISEIESCLNDSKVDFVLSSIAVEGSQYESMLLMQEELLVVVNQNHQLADRMAIDLNEIKDEKFVVPPKGYGIRANIDQLFRLAGITPNIVLECDHYTRINMLSVNLVVTLATHNALVNKMFPPNSVYLRVSRPQYKRSVYLYWNKSRYLSRTAVIVRQHLYEYCRRVYHQPETLLTVML